MRHALSATQMIADAARETTEPKALPPEPTRLSVGLEQDRLAESQLDDMFDKLGNEARDYFEAVWARLAETPQELRRMRVMYVEGYKRGYIKAKEVRG